MASGLSMTGKRRDLAVYGNDFSCRICGYSFDSDHEVADGLHVCSACAYPNGHRLWRWQESARERGLYDVPKDPESVRVNDKRASAG